MTEFEKQVEEILQPTGLSQFEIDLDCSRRCGPPQSSTKGGAGVDTGRLHGTGYAGRNGTYT